MANRSKYYFIYEEGLTPSSLEPEATAEGTKDTKEKGPTIRVAQIAFHWRLKGTNVLSSHKARGSSHCALHAELRRGGPWPTGMHCPFSKHQLRTIWASVVGTPRSADCPNNFVCSKPWDICLDCPGGKRSQAACGCVELHPGTHHYLERIGNWAAQSTQSMFDPGNGSRRVKHPESRGS